MQIAGRGDNGYWFRMQEPRSIEDIDVLLQNQERLRNAIGEERAAEICAAPHLFADAQMFRDIHAKARFRATFTTAAATLVGANLYARSMGLTSGHAALKQNKLLTVSAIVGTLVGSYAFWNMWVGYKSQARNEYLFAKNIRMLRNLQIRQ